MLHIHRVPQLNWDTSSYKEVVCLEEATESLLTIKFSEDQLQHLEDVTLELKHYLCHSQEVEQLVKAMTESSRITVTPEQCNGIILQQTRALSEVKTQKVLKCIEALITFQIQKIFQFCFLFCDMHYELQRYKQMFHAPEGVIKLSDNFGCAMFMSWCLVRRNGILKKVSFPFKCA